MRSLNYAAEEIKQLDSFPLYEIPAGAAKFHLFNDPEYKYGFVLVVPKGIYGELRENIDEIKNFLVEMYGAEEGKTLFEYNGGEVDCTSKYSKDRLANRKIIVIGTNKNNPATNCLDRLYGSEFDDTEYVGISNYWGCCREAEKIWGAFVRQESLETPESGVYQLSLDIQNGDLKR